MPRTTHQSRQRHEPPRHQRIDGRGRRPDWFEGLGYAVLHGPDIAPGEPAAERATYGEVVLVIGSGRPWPASTRPSPSRPSTRPSARSSRTETPSLVENNRRFHRLLTDGVDVEYRRADGSIAGDKVWLIDFDQPGQQRLAGRQPVHRHRGQAQPPARRRRLRQRPAAGRHRAEERRPTRTPRSEAPSTSSRPTSRRSRPVRLQRAAGRLRRPGGPPRHAHRRLGAVHALADHRRRDDRPEGHARARGAAQGRLRQASGSSTCVRHFIVFEDDGADDRQEAGRLPPVPRRQQGGRLHGPGRLARGRPAGRRRLAHAGQRQEPDDGLLRRQDHPAPGDGRTRPWSS